MTSPTNLGDSINRATERLQQQREAAAASSRKIAEERQQPQEGTSGAATESGTP